MFYILYAKERTSNGFTEVKCLASIPVVQGAGGMCRFTFFAGEYPNGETLIASKRDFTACKNGGIKDIFFFTDVN